MQVFKAETGIVDPQLINGRFLVGITRQHATYITYVDTVTRKSKWAAASARKLTNILPSYDSNCFAMQDSAYRQFYGFVDENGVRDIQRVPERVAGNVLSLSVLQHVIGDKFLFGTAASGACYLTDRSLQICGMRHILGPYRTHLGFLLSPLVTRYFTTMRESSGSYLVAGRTSTPDAQVDTADYLEFNRAVPPYNLRANYAARHGASGLPQPFILLSDIRWVNEDTCYMWDGNVVFRVTFSCSGDAAVSKLFVSYARGRVSDVCPSLDGKRAACAVTTNRIYIETFDRKLPAIRLTLSGQWKRPKLFWLADGQRLAVTDSLGSYTEFFVGDGSNKDTSMLIAANGKGQTCEVARAMAHDIYEERFGH